MSKTANGPPGTSFPDRAIPLLKEYREKLAAISAEARELGDPTTMRSHAQQIRVIERHNLQRKLQSLQAPATSLARHVSQRLEHSTLDDLDKLELQLRLAEFEAALMSAQQMVAAV